jgi:hypothetical protein
MKNPIEFMAKRKRGVVSNLGGPKDACMRADLTSTIAMLRYREKEADLRLSRVPPLMYL